MVPWVGLQYVIVVFSDHNYFDTFLHICVVLLLFCTSVSSRQNMSKHDVTYHLVALYNINKQTASSESHNTFAIFKSCKKVSKGAKIRNRYNQVPHPTQDTKKW